MNGTWGIALVLTSEESVAELKQGPAHAFFESQAFLPIIGHFLVMAFWGLIEYLNEQR